MNEVDCFEVQKLLKTVPNIKLLDARGVDYYNWEHISGALQLRYCNVKEQATALIADKKSHIITYCESPLCDASSSAYQALEELGYENIYEYSGGIVDWKNHRLQTARSNLRIADNIYKFPKQKFYSNAVGCYLVVEKEFILLIDGPQNLTEEHLDFILSFNKPIKIFMTHHATAGEAGQLQKNHAARIYLHELDQEGEWLTVKPDRFIVDGHQFSDNLQVVHTPGHSPGSSCLLERNSKILFTGDHLYAKDTELTDFIENTESHDLDPVKRFESAVKLEPVNFESIYPFHYQPIMSGAKDQLLNFINKHKKENT